MSEEYRNENLDASENVEMIEMEEVSRDYRTEIPNIVFELLAAGKISHFAFVLYGLYRRTAGERGKCWKGFRKLSQECKLSLDTIHKARLELQQSFPELAGRSLIKVQKGDNKKNQSDTVLIMDIWSPNHFYFKKQLTCSPHEHPPFAPRTPCSPHEQKKKPFKKELPAKKSSLSAEASRLVKDFHSRIQKLNEKVPNLTKAQEREWGKDFDIWLRNTKQKITLEEIYKAIDFIEWDHENSTSGFRWSEPIQSPSGFRRNYQKMYAKMQNSSKESKETKKEEDKLDLIHKNQIIANEYIDRIKSNLTYNYRILGNRVEIKDQRHGICPIAYSENGFRDQLENVLRKNDMLLPRSSL